MKEKKCTVAIMFILLAACNSIFMLQQNSLAVIINPLMIDLAIRDASVMGALVGTYAIANVFMQIPSGLLGDLWGTRKTVTTGMLVACLGTFVFASANSLTYAFIGRSVVGLGLSVLFISTSKYLTNWFKPSQFATLLSLIILSANFGGVLATVPLSFLVSMVGWRGSFWLIGLVMLILAILSWLIVRDRPDSSVVSEAKPQGDIIKEFKTIIKNRYTWALFIINFGVAGSLLAFSSAWSIPYLTQIHGLNVNQSASLMLVLFIGKMAGFPLISLISDKIKRRKLPVLIVIVLYFFQWGILFFSAERAPLVVLLTVFFFMGFFYGVLVLILSLAKESSNENYSGVAISIINISPFAGMAVMQPFLGYILDLGWRGVVINGVKQYPVEAYQSVFLTCLIFIIISFLFALKIRETYCKNTFIETVIMADGNNPVG
jgi:MFS family permease